MTPFEFRSVPLSNAVEIWASDALVGMVIYDKTRSEWLAEVGDQNRHWPSFGTALNFIEAVLQIDTWMDLRSPDLALPCIRSHHRLPSRQFATHSHRRYPLEHRP